MNKVEENAFIWGYFIGAAIAFFMATIVIITYYPKLSIITSIGGIYCCCFLIYHARKRGENTK